MPKNVSVKKRERSSAKARERNGAVKRSLATARRGVYEAVDGGDRDAAAKAMQTYFSLLDKAVKKGVLQRNNAGRRKSRAAARLAKMQG